MVYPENDTLRAEYIDTAVKAVALKSYKLKPLCTIDTSNAYTESYWREDNTALTGGTGSSVGGIPRFAPFPFGQVSETKVSSVIQKYGMEGVISYESEIQNYLPMIERTIVRVGQAVANKTDIDIEAVMGASYGNTFAITAGNEWDSATVANRKPVYDVLYGINMLLADNIDIHTTGGYFVTNGTDYVNIASNAQLTNSVNYKGADVIQNGVVGQLCGLTWVVTDSVTADAAYIVAKGSLVWKQQRALTVEQIKDPGIKTTIRAFELGVCQLQVPNGVCKITNTRA